MESQDFLLSPPPMPAALPRRRRAAARRDLLGLCAVLARVGSLTLRLAETDEEVRRIQRLRHHVFFTERGAIGDGFGAAPGRDRCPFDRNCDHLYVVADEPGSPGRIVGTYRLLRGDVAARHGGFYSETEFQLGPLLARHGGMRFLELGRSCVHPAYRTRRVIDLLWFGIGTYAAHHGGEVMIGCSSLPGTDPAAVASALSFALHHAAAPVAWQVRAQPGRAARLDALGGALPEPTVALATMPPLLKAYVRAGATFASEAAIDHAFNTIDLFTILPLAAAAPRYLARFGARETTAAA